MVPTSLVFLKSVFIVLSPWVTFSMSALVLSNFFWASLDAA